MKKLFFIFTLFILSSCSISNKIPSDDEWSFAINVLKDWVGNEGIFYYSQDSGIASLDFLKLKINIL